MSVPPSIEVRAGRPAPGGPDNRAGYCTGGAPGSRGFATEGDESAVKAHNERGRPTPQKPPTQEGPMTTPATDPRETILLECAAVAPNPWYPKDYAEAHGVHRDSLDPHLDELRLGGLIHLTDWV